MTWFLTVPSEVRHDIFPLTKQGCRKRILQWPLHWGCSSHSARQPVLLALVQKDLIINSATSKR